MVPPSVPGHGFPFRSGQPPVGVPEIADAFAALMTDVPPGSGARGGDRGAFVASFRRRRGGEARAMPQFVRRVRNCGTARPRAASRHRVGAPKTVGFPADALARPTWHDVGNVASAMDTVLLIGETGGLDRSVAAGPSARRGPTLRSALERVGYAVVQAENGAGVIERLSGPLPDLIVVTRPLGDMDTGELCARVRGDSTTERIPIVLLADGSTRPAGGSASADLVFPPSVSPAEVADRLRRLF